MICNYQHSHCSQKWIFHFAVCSVQIENPWKTILSRKYRPQLVLAAASTFFQQWTGINTIIFYGKAGMQANIGLMQFSCIMAAFYVHSAFASSSSQ